jgi:hypothetical protein
LISLYSYRPFQSGVHDCISDPEIQFDLLWDKNQDMTLEEVTQFVEAKDSGKRSASRLQDSGVVQAASSSYKKAKQTEIKLDFRIRNAQCENVPNNCFRIVYICVTSRTLY